MEREYDAMDTMPKHLDIEDYELSNLACSAAAAIDCHIKGIEKPQLKDYRYVTRLGKIFYLATKPSHEHPDWIPVRDDITLTVFYQNFLKNIKEKNQKVLMR